MPVLNEAISDHPELQLGTPGEHVLRLEIPPVLNAGDYSVGLWLGTDFEDLAWEEDVVSIHLEGGVEGRPDRVLQLRLPWEIESAG